MEWTPILFVIGAGLMLFMLYRSYKANPALFSKVNIGKSFYTMGILAIGLMAFIYILVLILKAK
jgi:VIT1/CCC1 family predicted Fe2+/Mn2+ transporter